jgi:hypothetical protein
MPAATAEQIPTNWIGQQVTVSRRLPVALGGNDTITTLTGILRGVDTHPGAEAVRLTESTGSTGPVCVDAQFFPVTVRLAAPATP